MGKTILITGAGRGIGLALAQQAAAAGHQVYGTVRDAGALAEHPQITPLVLDVTEEGAYAALPVPDRIDLLVCNAGLYLGRGGMDDAAYAAADWAQMTLVNVAAPFFAARAWAPRLAAAGGKLAILSSIMGSSARAPGGSYMYRATKAAVTNLGRNLAADLRPRGIAVGIYHPGWVRTDMGGRGADIDMADSASGLLARFDRLSLETSGVFEDYRGQPIPF